MIIILCNFLIKKFIKEPDNINSEHVRNQYGFLGGIVGIISNLILFLTKLIIGLLSSSISILADAFNNFFDLASSIITIIGFKLASKPADSEHPFGHGRIELITGLIVAFMIMLFGFEFLKTSFIKILTPNVVKFEITSFIILILSMLIKLWLSNFNWILGDKINSATLKASALDAKSDVFTSLCIIISFFTIQFTTLPIDGITGCFVSLCIIRSGYNLTKETISPLLGEAPSKEIVDSIMDILMDYNEIIGVHDLIVHNYGAGKWIASAHAEMPADLGAITMHEVADSAERLVLDKLNILLVIHTDPICTNNEYIKKTKQEIEDIIYQNSSIISIHDFRIVGENDKKNLIFDIVVKPSEIVSYEDERNLVNWVNEHIKKIYPNYNCIITIDKFYN